MTLVTWNPDDGLGELSNNNLTVSFTNSGKRATEGVSSGKVYFEVEANKANALGIGIGSIESGLGVGGGTDTKCRAYYSNGYKVPTYTAYGSDFTDGDIISVLLDMDNGIIEFWKNGVSQGIMWSDLKDLDVVYPLVRTSASSGTKIATANFGESVFSYPIPDGYKSYNSYQLRRMILKNTTTNQYYSLEEKTLILLPDSSYENITLHGIEARKEIRLDEQFDKIRTVIDNGDGTQSVTEQTVSPFSVYDYISKTPDVLIYTESTEDVTVTTTTEPFDIYDEFGDEVEALFYTDDTSVNEVDLILTKIWSPLDELKGDFEVVSLTETDTDMALKINSPSPPQEIFASGDISLLGVEAIDSIQITAAGNPKVAMSFDRGITYVAYKNGIWEAVTSIAEGMTVDGLNTLTSNQIKEYVVDLQSLRFAYYLEGDDEVDEITMRVSMLGVEELAKQKDYEMSYDLENKQIVFNIKKTGTYSVNYVDTRE